MVFTNADEFAARAEQLQPRLYRAALLMTGSAAQAQDAVAEALYRGFLSLRSLRRPEYAETWLTRIVINECKRILRRRRREQLTDTLPETAAEAFDALPLREAIRKLPQELRAVVALRYFSGYTLRETAQALGVPQGTVVTRQRRALQLLKLELED